VESTWIKGGIGRDGGTVWEKGEVFQMGEWRKKAGRKRGEGKFPRFFSPTIKTTEIKDQFMI
jgi:hypothetical protein